MLVLLMPPDVGRDWLGYPPEKLCCGLWYVRTEADPISHLSGTIDHEKDNHLWYYSSSWVKRLERC